MVKDCTNSQLQSLALSTAGFADLKCFCKKKCVNEDSCQIVSEMFPGNHLFFLIELSNDLDISQTSFFL